MRNNLQAAGLKTPGRFTDMSFLETECGAGDGSKGWAAVGLAASLLLAATGLVVAIGGAKALMAEYGCAGGKSVISNGVASKRFWTPLFKCIPSGVQLAGGVLGFVGGCAGAYFCGRVIWSDP